MEIPNGTLCSIWHEMTNLAQNVQLGTDVTDGILGVNGTFGVRVSFGVA